jgi:hypothetical protein
MIKSNVDGLGKWSKEIIDLVCDSCGVEKSIQYKLYTSYGYSNGDYFCRKCKMKKNNLEKWGVENPFQLESVKEKSRKTNLEKFGVEFISQSSDIKEKIKKSIAELDKDSVNRKREVTNLEKWGVKNVSQSEEIKGKKEETNIKNWGSSNNKKGECFRKDNFNIAKDKNYIKYLQEGKSLFNCDCGENHNFEIDIDVYSKRVKCKTIICTICNPIDKHQSGKEILLLNYIKSIYGEELIQNFRIGRMEIDIYLPQLKLGFEFNGIYWHSDKFKSKNFHKEKSEFFSKKDIRIIHIWEDDFDNKFDIIKSQIMNLIGKSNKIWARKCSIREVNDINLVRDFLNQNHIQGYVNSNFKLGLYYNNELVTLMTFDKFEGRKRMRDVEWNLNRFCNKLEHSIVGGASKLLTHFINNYNVQRIISYADRDWSKGDLYQILGFRKVSESKPDYKYLVGDKRIHKSNFKKSITGISESNLDIPKVWNCGKIKFEWKSMN